MNNRRSKDHENSSQMAYIFSRDEKKAPPKDFLKENLNAMRQE